MSEEKENYSITPNAFIDEINKAINKDGFKTFPVETKYPKERFLDYLNNEIIRIKETLRIFPKILTEEKETKIYALEQIKDKFKEIFEDK